MLPWSIEIGARHVAIWDAMFLLAVVVGYVALRGAATSLAPRRDGLRGCTGPLLAAAYVVTVYVTAVGAQLFSYAFDDGTTLLPPAAVSGWYYYLSPVAGPKTLYGAVLALPAAIMLARLPPIRLRLAFATALDLWTPSLLLVLCVVRVGCFLQGCCYGVRSNAFGLRFAEGSIVHADQVSRGLVRAGEMGLAVVPTQLAEALFLSVAFVWAYRAVVAGRDQVYWRAILAYSGFRFAIEFARADAVRNHWGPLSTSQWVAAAIIVATAAWRLGSSSRE